MLFLIYILTIISFHYNITDVTHQGAFINEPLKSLNIFTWCPKNSSYSFLPISPTEWCSACSDLSFHIWRRPAIRSSPISLSCSSWGESPTWSQDSANKTFFRSTVCTRECSSAVSSAGSVSFSSKCSMLTISWLPSFVWPCFWPTVQWKSS